MSSRNKNDAMVYTVESARAMFGGFERAGTGDKASHVDTIVQSFYDLIADVDGKGDLLEIADRHDYPITLLDRAVGDFLRAGLITEVKG